MLLGLGPAARPIRLVVLASAVAVAGFACDGNGDDTGAPPETTTTTAGVTTTTTEEEPTTTTTLPGGELVSCTNPEGFSISYPSSWEQVDCGQFHPEPFEPPGATDERVAAITAYVDPVALEVVSDPEGARDLERTELTIDGHEALRLAYQAGEDHLYGSGTPITLYAIGLEPGGDGQERTLFVDTVGLSGFSYEQNVEILDRMAPTVAITE